MPKRPKVWFGTLNDMRWIDAPVANFQSNSTGFNYSATTLRGDGFAKRSRVDAQGVHAHMGGQHGG